MMKRNSIVLLILCFCILFCTFFIVNSQANGIVDAFQHTYPSKSAEIPDYTYNSSQEETTENPYISFGDNRTYYPYATPIELQLNLKNGTINAIEYTNSGFTDISYELLNEKSVSLILNVLQNMTESKITLHFNLSSNETIEYTISSVNTKYGCFITPFEKTIAYENYYFYLKSNGIISQHEYDVLSAKLYNPDAYNNIPTIPQQNTPPDNSSVQATSSSFTRISGTFNWYNDDETKKSPLRSLTVKIYCNNSGTTNLIRTLTTNENGYFYCAISNNLSTWNDETTFLIRLYAGDSNVMVKKSNTTEDYYYDQTLYIEKGINVDVSKDFDMSTYLGQAFQISQAVIFARDYAWEMNKATKEGTESQLKPSAVSVWYPYGDGCSYNYANKAIRITGSTTEYMGLKAYSSWDTIMHEYGHHIQYIYDIITPGHGYTHDSFKNHIDYVRNYGDSHDGQLSKEEAVILAWQEAWPTVFALMAQNYYVAELTNIDKAGDNSYTAYNARNYSLEYNALYLGEACEQSIMAVLWDLFDSSKVGESSYDVISLGHTACWELYTTCHSKTFSEFVQFFYGEYPEKIYDLGYNLQKYNMSPSSVDFNSNQLSFSWIPQGGSTRCPNNEFVLIFFNHTKEEVYRTPRLDSLYYNKSEWNRILYLTNESFYVSVAAYEKSDEGNNYATGPYYSPLYDFVKPTLQEISGGLIYLSNNTKCALKSAEIKESQYVEYTFQCVEGGLKLFQTFGNSQIDMSLWNTNGDMLISNSNSGYNYNALFSYETADNSTYILRVRSSYYGTSENADVNFMVGITPANGERKYNSFPLSNYDYIYNIQTSTEVDFISSAEPYFTKVVTFTPTVSGTYDITVSCRSVDGSLDSSSMRTYLYVIDPRSTDPNVLNINASTGTTHTLSITLEKDIPYLLIYSYATLPIPAIGTNEVTISIKKTS